MSEKLKQFRKEKAIHDVGQALMFCIVIAMLMGILAIVLTLIVLTFSPHIGVANDVYTMPRWQYNRDTAIYVLAGVAFTAFLGLFSYWLYQDGILLKQQKEAVIRETIEKVLKEEKKE